MDLAMLSEDVNVSRRDMVLMFLEAQHEKGWEFLLILTTYRLPFMYYLHGYRFIQNIPLSSLT